MQLKKVAVSSGDDKAAVSSGSNKAAGSNGDNKAAGSNGSRKSDVISEEKQETKNEKPETIASKPETRNNKPVTEKSYTSGIPSVAAEKMMKENSLKTEDVTATGKSGRITKGDVVDRLQSLPSETREKINSLPLVESRRGTRREKMTMLRKRVAERLVAGAR